jgi:Tol biopolymer transport system component
MIRLLLLISLLLVSVLMYQACEEPNTPPQIVITSGPDDHISTKEVTFAWEGTDDDGSVVSYLYSLDNSTPNQSTTRTSITLEPGRGNHRFYIQAKDNDGALSQIERWDFWSTFELTVPSPVDPWNNYTYTDATPQFRWSGSYLAEVYELSVDNNSDFSTPEIHLSSITDTYYLPINNLEDGHYYWRVRARYEGDWSAWADVWEFTIDHPETYVLSDQEYDNISTINPDAIVFNNPVSYSEDDIVVMGVTELTPKGLLRRVTGVSQGGLTIQTTQASLEQAIEEGEISYHHTLLPGDTTNTLRKPGVSNGYEPSLFDFNIPLDNVVLFDQDGNTETQYDQLIANGSIEFNYDLDLDLDISGFHLNRFLFKNTFTEQSDITVQYQAGGYINGSETIWVNYFSPISILPPLSPIPIIIVPSLEISISYSGTPWVMEANFVHNAELSPGIEYENNSWNNISTLSSSFDYDLISVQNNVNLQVGVQAALNYKIYNIGGPYGAILAYMELDYSDPWQLNGGFMASLGLVMDIFSYRIADYSATVIEYEQLIAEGSDDPPQPEHEGLIAFESNRWSDYGDIYIMTANGDSLRRVPADNPGWDGEPAWSPDNTMLAFASSRGDEGARIFTMNVDGSNQLQLTQDDENLQHDMNPSWSPDGSQIVFQRYANVDDIMIINVDGTDLHNLTNTPDIAEWWPDWSPDGTQIIYSVMQGEVGLYIINANGTNSTRIYDEFVYQSSFSINNKIAFIPSEYDNFNWSKQLFTINPDGTGLQQLTFLDSNCDHPSWSSDGTKIVFTIFNDETFEDIYIIDSNGQNMNPVSIEGPGSNVFRELNPVWSR